MALIISFSKILSWLHLEVLGLGLAGFGCGQIFDILPSFPKQHFLQKPHASQYINIGLLWFGRSQLKLEQITSGMLLQSTRWCEAKFAFSVLLCAAFTPVPLGSKWDPKSALGKTLNLRMCLCQ
jgi:hypothetical protein